MLSKLLLTIIVILFSAKIGGFLAKKAGISTIIGEIAAGILIGPFVLGNFLTLEFGSVAISLLSDIGIAFLLFLIGLKLDLKSFEKFMMRGILTAFLGAFLPFVFGTFIGFNLLGLSPLESILLGGFLIATSTSVIGRLLEERNKVKSRGGMTLLDAVVVDDVIAVVLITFLLGFATNEIASFNSFLISSAEIFIFFVAIIFAGQKFGDYLIKAGEYLNLRLSEGLLSLILIIVFLFSYISELLGLSIVIGAFLAGVILDEKHLKEVEHEVYSITYGLFIPIFFVLIGTRVDPLAIYHNLWWILPVFAGAVLTKFIGSFLGSFLAGVDLSNSILVGVGMIPRGEIAFVVAGLAVKEGVLSATLYSVVIAVLTLTILITPPLFNRVAKK